MTVGNAELNHTSSNTRIFFSLDLTGMHHSSWKGGEEDYGIIIQYGAMEHLLCLLKWLKHNAS